MSDPFQQLLTATIEHLEGLKRRGTSFISTEPGLLRELRNARPRPGTAHALPTPATVVGPATQLETQPTRPERAGIEPSKEIALANLEERVLACDTCNHLAESREKVVFGVGNVNAELMFVGEAPGAEEDQQGEPFVGEAGKLLTRMIQAMDFQREDIYIANVLKCRPDTPGQSKGNRKPTPEEMKTCLPYLMEQIKIIQPKVIVALGATAMEGLFGKATGITKLRGTWHTFEGIPVMPTFHPSYLLHNPAPSEKRKVWEDMLLVMDKLGVPISEKQRGYFR